MEPGEVAAAVLTVSDGVDHGTRQDRSGDALAERLAAAGFAEVRRRVVPDDPQRIATALRELAAGAALVVTTGGTGLGPRDVTPEATRQVIDREVPGLAEAMRAAGRASTPMADLSRGVVGAYGASLVVNLPGSPRGALESLEAVLVAIPHALELLTGRTAHDGGAHGHAGAAHEHGHAGRGEGHDHAGHGAHRHTGGEDAHDHRSARGIAATPAPGDPATAVHAELARRVETGEEVVLATAVRTEGSPPCQAGQQLLLGPGGPLAGTLGCAEFDAAASAHAADALAAPEPLLRTYRHDLGTVEVQLQAFRPRPPLIVLGATPVALWLLRWGRDLGYEPVLVEDRTERVTAELWAAASRVAAGPGEVELRADAAAVHTDHDAPKAAGHLAALLRAGLGSVALMGSRRHATPHLEALAEAGVDADAVHTPAGLDLGGRTPQEIALSILAGVVAQRHGRPGGFLDEDAGR